MGFASPESNDECWCIIDESQKCNQGTQSQKQNELQSAAHITRARMDLTPGLAFGDHAGTIGVRLEREK